MIVFHEGLPGSGKSYEAVVRRIIPALKEGRTVQAYVEGLDHVKLAQLAEISEERCRELLLPIKREQVQQRIEDPKSGKVLRVIDSLPELAKDNALIVLDEAQNFWGVRDRLDQELVKFVTEHRHRGIDIVLMGQDLRDVNALWRRRVEIKLCFLKLSGLGTSKGYRVTTWRHLGQDKFEKVGTIVTKYDTKYFGSYASHVSDSTNTADYKESRATIWNHPGLKWGVPIVIGLALWGGWYTWGFFHGRGMAKSIAAAKPASVPQTAQASTPAPQPASAAPAPREEPRTPQERLITGLTDKYRIRLAGLMQRGERITGVVEWIDGGSRVMHRMTLDDLRNLGAAVAIVGDSAVLQIGKWQEIATTWPIEGDLRVSDARQQLMKPAPDSSAQAPGLVSLGGSVPQPPQRAQQSEPAGDLNVRPTRTVVTPPKG